MKNFGVHNLEILFFGQTSLKEARQSICSSISLFLIMIDPKIVSRELLSIADLTGAQALHIHELTKVVMVNKNEDFVLAAFSIVVSSRKGLTNSQYLLIVSLVLSFSRNHLFGEKSYGVPLANFRLGDFWILRNYVIGKMLIRNRLTEDFTNSKTKSISFNANIIFWLKIIKMDALIKIFYRCIKVFWLQK